MATLHDPTTCSDNCFSYYVYVEWRNFSIRYFQCPNWKLYMIYLFISVQNLTLLYFELHILNLRDTRFTERCWWRTKSTVTWRRVTGLHLPTFRRSLLPKSNNDYGDECSKIPPNGCNTATIPVHLHCYVKFLYYISNTDTMSSCLSPWRGNTAHRYALSWSQQIIIYCQ